MEILGVEILGRLARGGPRAQASSRHQAGGSACHDRRRRRAAREARNCEGTAKELGTTRILLLSSRILIGF